MKHVNDTLERHLGDADIVALLEGRASADVRGHLLLCDDCRILYETSGAVLAEDLAVTSPRRRATPRRRWVVAAAGVATAAALALALVPPAPDAPVELRSALPSELWPVAERISGQWMVVPGFEDVAAQQVPLRRSDALVDREAVVEPEVDRSTSGALQVEDYVRGIVGLVGEGDYSKARAWATRASRDFDDDPRIVFLDALTAQCVGDFATAVERLEAQCDGGRGTPVLCADLAIVLGQLGRADEARRVLAWLEDADAAPSLLERGRRAVASDER